MRIKAVVCAGGLLFAALASAGCLGDDTEGPDSGTARDSGVDAPAETKPFDVAIDPDMSAADAPVVKDGPEDGPACPAGLKPFYRDPGCGGEAVVFCAASDDGCLGPEICTCEGKTSRLCTWNESPFRHYGACGTDGGQERPLTWPI